jgi:hypothetical protein
MLSHKSLAACATLTLLCSFSATNVALAGNAAESPAASCAVESRASIRHVGHPGRSLKLPRRAENLQECPATKARKTLTLASFLDAPGGKALVDGNIERASRQIGGKVANSREQTNLCVLHTLQRNWTDARSACDSAVEMAARSRSIVDRDDRVRVRQANQAATAAYSNRAVMNWLSGDTGAAYVDLANARAISPKADFVSQNFEIAVRVPAQVMLPIDPYQIG